MAQRILSVTRQSGLEKHSHIGKFSNMHPALLRITLAVGIFLPITVTADFWPEFRGPRADGHAPNAQVPLKWGPNENVRWKSSIAGRGWSSPVVAEGKIFVTTAVESDEKISLSAICLDLGDGSAVWEEEVFSAEPHNMHAKNSQASPTPVYSEGKVFVHFGHFGTACLNAENGKPIWRQTSLAYSPVHGNGGSPLLFNDKLIFSCDGAENPFVVALNVNNGEIEWKTDRNVDVSRTFSFSTPLLIEVDQKPQVVIPGSGAVISYDPSNGEEIWRCRYGEGYSVVPRPVYDDGRVFVCSGFNRATLYAIRVDGKGDVTDSHIAWENSKAIPKESSPIVVDGIIYLNDDKGVLSAFDAETGEELFREKLPNTEGYSASPVYASGHLFFHGGDGVTTVIKPGKRFQKVSENRIGEFGLSSFAVLEDGFLIRAESNLFRVGK